MTRLLVGTLALAALAVAVAPAADKDAAKADRAAAVKGNTEFACDLYAKLRGQDGNLFFSPYSISTALAMTRAGARGETADQMDKTLHFTLKGDKLHAAFGELIKEANGDPKDAKRGYQLSTANALWGQKGFSFLPEFVKLTKDDYGAGLNEVDFVGATEDARKTINAWVEKETRDKIKDLLPQGVLTTDTRLVLTNAIYFKGDWASQFKKDLTKEEPFAVAADKKVNAPLMHQKATFRYYDGGSFQALEMPYAGKDLAMVVLLPKKADGLPDLEKDLTADRLTGWVGKLNEAEVDVALPKFKTTSQFSLKPTLSEMGMSQAFTNAADFSGMDGKKDLQITDVIHKAFVDVNEEGTEAAGATGVIVGLKSERAPTPEFRADHPFVFLIRDTRSGGVLFLGRVADPTK
jgi:serpin B